MRGLVCYISINNIHNNKTAHDTDVDGVEWEGPEVGYHLRSSKTLIKDHVYRESMKLWDEVCTLVHMDHDQRSSDDA